MRDTPMVDAMMKFCFGTDEEFVRIKDAAKLERELNAATSEIERLRKANLQLREGAEEQKRRIKRLEEAGDRIIEAGWSVQDWSGMCVVWAKFKEAKP